MSHFSDRRRLNELVSRLPRADGHMTEWSGDDAALVAGLVLLRVADVRDRLALECVSRLWRTAVQAAGDNWQGGLENCRFHIKFFALRSLRAGHSSTFQLNLSRFWVLC